MNETLHLVPTDEPLAEWCGKQVKVKGLINGSPEVLMIDELVDVFSIGAVLSSRKGRRTFFPWASVVSLSLDEEGQS